jgi:uncharacterized protein involved in exopolysaccharide biosynthesis
MDISVYSNPNQRKDEIRLKDLVEMLLQYRYRVMLSVIGITVLVAVVSLLVPKEYDAAVVISPVTNTSDKSFGGSGASGALGGLAALAGMSLGSDSKKAESVATLQSQALTGRYIRENNLLPTLYSDLWDTSTGKWTVTDPKKVPTLWKAIQKFKHVRTISVDTKTGLVTLTIRWEDPDVAAKWANGLVKLTNDYAREAALVESDRNVAYLTQQAAATDVVGIKQAIYNLLQSEINKSMIARGTDEYAFKVIDPALVSEKAAFPEKTIWVLTAFFGSLILAIFFAFCRISWQKS